MVIYEKTFCFFQAFNLETAESKNLNGPSYFTAKQNLSIIL